VCRALAARKQTKKGITVDKSFVQTVPTQLLDALVPQPTPQRQQTKRMIAAAAAAAAASKQSEQEAAEQEAEQEPAAAAAVVGRRSSRTLHELQIEGKSFCTTQERIEAQKEVKEKEKSQQKQIQNIQRQAARKQTVITYLFVVYIHFRLLVRAFIHFRLLVRVFVSFVLCYSAQARRRGVPPRNSYLTLTTMMTLLSKNPPQQRNDRRQHQDNNNNNNNKGATRVQHEPESQQTGSFPSLVQRSEISSRVQQGIVCRQDRGILGFLHNCE
jgi:hypothetical protein